MKTSEERQKHFEEDLRILLSKHGANMALEEVSDGSRWSVPEHSLVIQMDSIYNDDGDLIADFCEFVHDAI